jgi:hypothetical protein
MGAIVTECFIKRTNGLPGMALHAGETPILELRHGVAWRNCSLLLPKILGLVEWTTVALCATELEEM